MLQQATQQLLSGNISQSGCMVMSGGRESGSGSGMGAIRLEKGELDNGKERVGNTEEEMTVRSKQRGRERKLERP